MNNNELQKILSSSIHNITLKTVHQNNESESQKLNNIHDKKDNKYMFHVATQKKKMYVGI